MVGTDVNYKPSMVQDIPQENELWTVNWNNTKTVITIKIMY